MLILPAFPIPPVLLTSVIISELDNVTSCASTKTFPAFPTPEVVFIINAELPRERLLVLIVISPAWASGEPKPLKIPANKPLPSKISILLAVIAISPPPLPDTRNPALLIRETFAFDKSSGKLKLRLSFSKFYP